MTTVTSYWCFRCRRLVRVWTQDSVVCPNCDAQFLEEVENSPGVADAPRYIFDGDGSSPLRIRRHRRAGAGDRSPFNPVIVLRGPADGGGGGRDANRPASSSFELYYDEGAGSGLRPLPPSMSEFLMGSGFERLLDQLAQIEMNGIAGRGFEHPPASKAAIESMPTIEITASHVGLDCHCAVCTEAFELGNEAREMPCQHIYHQDCILPWLAIRNSCPVCRHEIPSDERGRGTAQPEGNDGIPAAAAASEDETVGLTIWRLPGGGFAVGRFSGGTRAGERQLPVVYTEMDGGFNSGGAPRRVSLTSRDTRFRENGRIGRVFRNFFTFFGRWRSSSSSSSSRSSSNLSSSSSSRPWISRVLRVHSGFSVRHQRS